MPDENRRQGAPGGPRGLDAQLEANRRKRDAHERRLEEPQGSTPDRALSDQPAHGNSLAKQKLFAKSEPSMINFALINGRANLVCDIQAPSQDDSVALVLWYKDDSLAPIYTVDARKANSLERAKISVDEHYSDRLAFNTKTRPAQLELEPLRQEDEGEYRCRVDFKRGRTVNTIIALRIIIPPQELSIFMVGGERGNSDNDDDEGDSPTGHHPQPPAAGGEFHSRYNNRSLVKLPAGGLIGPFNEDSELELVCLAQGGKPRPQVTWRRDFNVLNSTEFIQLDRGGTSVALKLPALNKQHLLSIFTCQATNNNLTSALQSSITLDLNLKPQEVVVRQLNQHEHLQVGQTATFECVTTGSRPQATIHWLFQGRRHDTPMSVDQQQTSSKLSLVLQRSFNEQPLTCVAENPRISPWPQQTRNGPSSASSSSSSRGTTASKQTTIKLDVHYPPQLSVRLDSRQAPPPPPPSGAGRANSAPEVDEQSASSNRSTGERPTRAPLQEGNDVYLYCHLEANPRPLKPIVWRFNGRPLVPTSPAGGGGGAGGSGTSLTGPPEQTGAIVINGQSLVLRKVTRFQSGGYTCEATNQHGTGASKPYELTIKHAPVCQTDDILVYEAAPGQQVNIDCGVLANPSKSVHFSWFVAQEPNQQNVSEWLRREASLDEQLDVSSAQLKFKVRQGESSSKVQMSENSPGGPRSLALIKCKAKNEIGLQQRVCLFQVVAARPPELRHSCSLADAGAQSLRVSCTQNEHLKTNEFQLTSGGGGSSSSSSSGASAAGQEADPLAWMRNYEAIRASMSLEGSRGDSAANREERRTRRLVWPPEWLLVELFRAVPPGPAPDSSSRVGRNDSQVVAGGDQSPARSTSYELLAYVVVSEAHQLARVKSMLEENKRIFEAQPRDVYYVRAQHSNSSSSSSSSSQSQSSSGDSKAEVQATGGLELASAFNFSVPNLEPETRYKLQIYAQNLANKTRDWLVVRGETQRQQQAGRNLVRSDQQQQLAASLGQSPMGPHEDVQADGSGEQSVASSNFSLAHSKSIVMRSEQQASGGGGSGAAGESGEPREDPAASNSGEWAGHHQHQPREGVAGRLTGLQLAANKLMHHLEGYKDQALAYASKRPLLSIPAALVGCLLVGLSVIYLSGALIQLVRRGGARRRQSLADGSGSGGGGGSGGATDKHSSESSNFSSADSSSSSNQNPNSQQQQGHPHDQRKHSQGESPLGAADELERRKQLKLASQLGALDQLALDDSFASSAHSNGPFQHTELTAGGRLANAYALETLDALTLADQQHRQMEQHNRQQVALMELSNNGWPDQAGACLHLQQMGSLNRRPRHQPSGLATVYLSEGGPQNPAHDHLIAADQQQQQQQQHRTRRLHLGGGGSIDRRCATGSQAFAAGPYQPLFVGPQNSMTNPRQAPVPRARRAKSSAHSTSQHRVAFDLSNQREQDRPSPLNSNQLLVVATSGCDSSSGSNNSTAATTTTTGTADSGHESPGTTGGETNSCQSGGGGQTSNQALTTCRKHQQHLQAQQNRSPACNCQAQKMVCGPTGIPQMQLIEFPSPSSQESSTLLQSCDSSFDHHQQNQNQNQNQNHLHRTNLYTPDCPNGGQFLIQNHHQMATSFASNAHAEPAPEGARLMMMMSPYDLQPSEADNWL